MSNPIEVINVIKDSMEEVILENNLTGYNGESINDLFRLYSADFCSILLSFFPGATVMINKNYLECALMISGNIYGSSGILNKDDYVVATSEELGLIIKGFKHISDFSLGKLLDKINSIFTPINNEYMLRMND